MKSYWVTWTDAEGRKRVSVVSYNKSSAEDRKEQLEGEGCTDVEIVETKPSERPDVGA
ncbi:hypothetical protein [Streptomyces sp. NPDC058297]|uniref:hypothetical protein n=1 Tax=Streptomyces sp. NPDC058297 TaxID=3346433 RepID=UPI0036EE8402